MHWPTLSLLPLLPPWPAIDLLCFRCVNQPSRGLYNSCLSIQLFKRLAKRLLQGQALNNEDLADTLTLKDHMMGNVDFAHALQIIAATKVCDLACPLSVHFTHGANQGVSQGRLQSAARSVWRRVLIDDECVPFRLCRFLGLTGYSQLERL